MSIFTRIEECRKLGETTTALCFRMGVVPRVYSDVQRGCTPRQVTLQRMAKGLKVSELWLEKGQGPKDPDEYERMLEEWNSNSEGGHVNA